jgi:hypothetical protein
MTKTIAALALLALALLAPRQQAAAEDRIGEAIFGATAGALIGGLETGRPSGAIFGAFTGASAGAIIGGYPERRPGYFWWHGDCYRTVPGGYQLAPKRMCY